MNKVFNWTVGSFFRTIGRMLAFFITGIAIAYILAQSDLKIGNIFRYTLGVHASTWQNVWVPSATLKEGDEGSWSNLNLSGDKYYHFFRTLSGTQIYFINFDSQKSLPNNASELYFNIRFRVNTPDSSTTTTQTTYANCTIHSNVTHPNSAGDMADDVEYEYTYFKCGNSSSTSTTSIDEHKFSLTLFYTYNSNTGYQNPCYAISNSGDTFSFSCPVSTNNVSGIAMAISTLDNITFTAGLNYLYSIEIDSSQQIIQQQQETNQAITNQTQQQQQQHEEIMDSNTTQAEDDAQDFFENFDAPDVGGLSAIITAPLSTIQSLLNATCTNLVLPLPYVNKNLTLPCMNDIYTEHFGAFFTLYQTIILGIIAYRCIRSIFFDLQGFADPSDDRIEVIDL